MDLSRLEIRKIKYNAYIEKHPEKPYGYYALGELEMISKSYGTAINYFTKALSLDDNYPRAKIGYLICLVQEQKYIQAIKYFSKKCTYIAKKNILLRDMLNGICVKDAVTNPEIEKPATCRKVNLGNKYYRIYWMYRRSENPVAALLLALHFYENKANKQEKHRISLFEDLVNYPGIPEALRWFMIKTISDKKPDIFEDNSLAALFNYIPGKEVLTSYANKIFSVALLTNNEHKINRLYRSISDSFIPLTNDNMWHFVYVCHQKGRYNSSVMFCCKSLIKSGWIDSVIAGAIYKMKELNMGGLSGKEEEIIKLFGY